MKNNYSTTITFLSLMLIVAASPAIAQTTGGLEKVNTFMEGILDILRGVSITVVTIAIIWAGYKLLWKNADIMEVGKITLGGLLIGGAAELARYIAA